MRIYERELSGAEAGMWLGAQTVPINFTMTALIRGSFNLDALRAALVKVRQTHPLLAVRIARDAEGKLVYTTIGVPEIPIRVIPREHDEDWQQAALTELNTPFDFSIGPLVRLTWLRSEAVQELILTCHHGGADGLAAAYILDDLLRALGEPDSLVEPLPLTPGLSALVPDFPGRRRMVWVAQIKSAVLRLFLRFKKKTEQKPPAPPPVQYQLLTWTAYPEETQALLARCRTERTSVHAALSTAFLRAFGELRGDGWNRNIQSPINLRKQLTQPMDRVFGCYIGIVKFKVDGNPSTDFWEIARTIKAGFVQRMANERIFPQIVEIGIIMRHLSSQLTPELVFGNWMDFDYDLSISNLGRLDMTSTYGPLTLEAVYGPVVSGNTEEIVLGVNTVDDQIQFSLLYTESSMTAVQAEEIQKNAMAMLQTAVHSKPITDS